MLDTIQKMNKDRFRRVFCDQDFYTRHQDYFLLWKTRFQSLSNVEKTQAWVVALACLRRPKDWFGGKRQNVFLDSTTKYQHPLNLRQLFEGTPVCIPPKLNLELNLIDFINICKIKAFPESCNRSLCFIANERYPLIITKKIPTPQELLQLQINGKRIITINEDHNSWPNNLYSGRDFLGFVLHDLIHADHFFYNPQHRDGQLGFFKFIQNMLSDEGLTLLLQAEPFKTGFEYIISDMNSHPVHLFQTLKALLVTEIKNDSLAKRYWTLWISKSKLSPTEALAIEVINTLQFDVDSAKTIEALCARMATGPNTRP